MANLSMVREDTAFFKFQRLNNSGEPITTQAQAVYFTVKKNYKQEDVVLQKKMSDMTFDADGTYHITIVPADTTDLNYGTYVYDLEVTDADGGYVQTIARGTFTIEEEVTWEANKT